jgi:5'-nucleotidase
MRAFYASRSILGLSLALLTACGGATSRQESQPRPSRAQGTGRQVTLSILGTNDLHGHIEALPAFSGYVANVRRARAADGDVVLLDGGDMFQGTLESNLSEGAPITAAYRVIGYDAVTIGNHEFDYGPLGERATPASPSDDRRGALRARIAESPYPFLTANLVDRTTHERASIGTEARPVLPTVVLEKSGLRIGVIGVTTEETLHTTIAANVDDLALLPLAEAIQTQATLLRAQGVNAVLVAAHAGGRCAHFEDPDDLSSCETDEEVMELAAALPEGTVDAIVAGHTHQGMAHRVRGIPIIESFSYGRAFGRIDLTFDAEGHLIERHIFAPTQMCRAEACASENYEGAPVTPMPEVARIAEEARAHAESQRQAPVGITLADGIHRDGNHESALGNLFTDLMRQARPQADVALYNGGGLRADLPEGPLAYGSFYEALPFDNRFAFVRMRGSELAAMLLSDATQGGSFLSVSGVHAEITCTEGTARIVLTRPDGRVIADDEELLIVTSDFLATGGDEYFSAARARDGGMTIEDGEPMREAMVEALRAHGGTLSANELFTRETPRVRYPGERPVTCTP